MNASGFRVLVTLSLFAFKAMSNGKAKAGEEDLDDLDDVLDQFTKPEVPPQTKPTAPAPSSASVPSGSEPQAQTDAELRGADSALREAWYKMIIQGLEDGKGDGLGALPDNPGRDAHTKEQSGSLKDEKQNMPEADDPFQKAIRQAMDKLQDSDDTLKQEGLESFLSSLGDLKLDEDAEGGENIESMLETMMSQLMSKDILYEPLKELDTKYPDYLAQNAPSLSREDLSRFTDQRARVSQIVAIFEDSSYSDDNTAQSTQILRLMNEMQSYGSPPSEIMGPMPPGFEFGADGMPKLPDGCVIL
ncbi:Pex19 protein family-domain-containing protein [Gautieria morchelliformis]|nr:Pex19 protein family-domain-containing protein [Gautieria morchelliformis]